MLRKPGESNGIRKSLASARRKTQESPDDTVRKLQRMSFNKKCADCMAKLPQSVNLTHGTFVCMACSGVHREFNHRIKGIGHSSFTAEEAAFLSSHGNDVVNGKLLANFSKSERLRSPDGSIGTVDGQLLRVWLRRKYLDKAWQSRDNDSKNNTNPSPITSSNTGHEYQSSPTKTKIPSKKKKAAPAKVDLLGDIFAEATPVAPVDDAWDAFGGSTSNSSAQEPFQKNSGSGDHSRQTQQQSSYLGDNSGSSQLNFQPSFDSTSFNITSQPGLQQDRVNLPTQPGFNANFPPQGQSQQQGSYGFDQHPASSANFPTNLQDQQQGSSSMGQPMYQGNVQTVQSSIQQQQTQPNQRDVQSNFKTEVLPAQSAQQPVPTPQQDSAFNCNFHNVSLTDQSNPTITSGNQQFVQATYEQGLPLSGQQQHSGYNQQHQAPNTFQQPNALQPPQQHVQMMQNQNQQFTETQSQPSFNADFSNAQQGNQQQQQRNTPQPPQQNVQTMQNQNQQFTETQAQPSLNADFSNTQQGNQQQQQHNAPQPPQQHVQMMQNQNQQYTETQSQPSFNADFSNAQQGNQQQQQRNAPQPPQQHVQMMQNQNQQYTDTQSQPSFNADFSNTQQGNQQHNASQPPQQHVQTMQNQNQQFSETQSQPSLNADFSNAQQGNQQQQQPSVGARFPNMPHGHQQSRTVGEMDSQQMVMPQAGDLPTTVSSPNDLHSTTFAESQEGNNQPQATQHIAQTSIASNSQLQQQGQPSVPCLPNSPDELPSNSLGQQSIPASKVNGVGLFPPTSQMKNMMPQTVNSGEIDPFDGLALQSNNNDNSNNGTHNDKAADNIPSTHVKDSPSNYFVGQKLNYRDSSNNQATVEIMKVHLDDGLVPFYTIKMPDGREKQTDDNHLSSNENGVFEPTTVESSEEGVANFEVNNVDNNSTKLMETQNPHPKVNEITTMLHSINEHQLELVYQFITQMIRPPNSLAP